MKTIKWLIFGILIFTCKMNFAQYYSTNNYNQVNKFKYFDFSAKGAIGLSLPYINEQSNKGIEYGVGILADYYLNPITAIHSGLEFNHTLARRSITDKELVSTNGNASIQDVTYLYNYYFVNIKMPIGILLNLSNLGKGFLFGVGLYANIGIDGKITIQKNDQAYIDMPAYEYDVAKREFSNKFKRASLQLYMSAAYQLNNKTTIGSEIIFGINDILNNQIFSAYNNSISIYISHRLRAN